MKKKILVVAAAFLLTPMMAGLAQADGGYLVGKAGVYLPTDGDVDAGFNGEIGYGYDLVPGPGLLAIEGTVGYFNTQKTEDYYDYTSSYGFRSSYRMETDAYVVPLALSLKGGVQAGPVMLYIGGGVDLLFVNMEMKYGDKYSDYYYDRYRYSDSDNDVIWGGHVMAGITFDINPHMFIGAEAKYLFTQDMNMSFYGGQDIVTGNLDGFTISAVFGFRF